MSYTDILQDGLTIWQVDDLRPVIVVRRGNGSGWIIKQPGSAKPHDLLSLQREAAALDLLSGVDDLAPHLTLPVRFDADVHAMTVPYVGSANAWTFLVSRDCDWSRIARTVAVAYQVLHDAVVDWRSGGAVVPTALPWILTLGGNEDVCPDTLDFVRQDKNLCAAIKNIRDNWQSNCVIHGDAKLENVLLDEEAAHAWVVDWSVISQGDPTWDIAGIIQSVLTLWLAGMSMQGNEAAIATEQGSFLKSEVDDFIRAFLSVFELDEQRKSLVFQMVGARLLQTAYEHIEPAGGASPRHVAMLKLAKAALLSPQEMGADYGS